MSKLTLTKSPAVTLEQRAIAINRCQQNIKDSAAQFAAYIVLMGLELKAAKKELGETRGRKSLNSSHSETNSFEGWLEGNCPAISRATAYRYIAIAEGCKGKLIKNADEKFLAILEKSSSLRNDRERATLHKEVSKITDGKTLSEVAQDVGVAKKSQGSGRATKPEGSGDDEGDELTPEQLADRQAQSLFFSLQEALLQATAPACKKLALRLPRVTDDTEHKASIAELRARLKKADTILADAEEILTKRNNH